MTTHTHDYTNQFRTWNKSRHLRAPSIEDKLRFEVEDEQCLSSMYLVRAASEPEPITQKIAPSKPTYEAQIKLLSTVYEFDESAKEFIIENPFLFQPLLQAIHPLQTAFNKKLSLRLDLLKEGDSEQLFVLIETNLGHDKALKKLNAFDKNWWFHVPPGIHEVLEFTLEFV